MLTENYVLVLLEVKELRLCVNGSVVHFTKLTLHGGRLCSDLEPLLHFVWQWIKFVMILLIGRRVCTSVLKCIHVLVMVKIM